MLAVLRKYHKRVQQVSAQPTTTIRSTNVSSSGQPKLIIDLGEREDALDNQPFKRSPQPSDGQRVASGYRLLKRIGKGSYGEVWKAEAPGGVEVAVKIIRGSLDAKETQHELKSLDLFKRLRHAFLVQTQAYWIQEDGVYVAMELADGSLSDRLKECRKAGLSHFPLPELVRYVREAAEALDYLNRQGLLHRDIKPENILLLEGHAKVADFGLARLSGDRKEQFTATSCGTPHYMAPEVWAGKASPHTDQYSLAATYVSLRLGRPMFTADNYVSLMREHLECLPDLTSLPAAEQRALHRALAKDPKQRYPSCGAFVVALERALSSELRPAPPVRGKSANVVANSVTQILSTLFLRRGRKPGIRWLALVLSMVLACALLGLGIGYLLFTTRKGKNTFDLVRFPPGYQAEASSQFEIILGKKYPKQIVHVLADGKRIPFVLIPWRPETDDPKTFYIMIDKVSIALFRQFASEENAVQHAEWEKGAWANGAYLRNQHEQLPVMGVDVEDADRFAQWLKGKLPTIHQWDKAAGRYEVPPRDGPYVADWDPTDNTQIAVNREKEGPLPVGTASKDRSPFGCRDMAGNGWEWTRNLLHQDLLVPYAGATEIDRVRLRGRSYQLEKPFRFADLERIGEESQSYKEPNPQIGFRVVLEP